MNPLQKWLEIIEQLKQELSSRIASKYHEVFFSFVDNFFAIMSKEEIDAYKWSDFRESTYHLWKKIENFTGEAEIHVFNADSEQMWHSDHTIIHIIQYDIPFIVDSVRMKLNEQGITSYLILNCATIAPQTHKNVIGKMIGVVSIEIDKIIDQDKIISLKNTLKAVLLDVQKCVDDFMKMKEKVVDIANFFRKNQAQNSEFKEIEDYLHWILNDNFTFLGFEQIDFKRSGNLHSNKLGLLNDKIGFITREDLEPEMDENFISDSNILWFAKASVRSTVHRPAYPDFIIIKRFDNKGKIEGEYRILGLYTSPVFNQNFNCIPILRKKCQAVIKRSGFQKNTHVCKELIQILQIFPREELFPISEEQLFFMAISILQIQERNHTKVFMRHDRNGYFCSVLVYIPREVYSTALRIKIQNILYHGLNATDGEFFTFFSESVLARVHFILRLKQPYNHTDQKDHINIIKDIIHITSSWDGKFKKAMIDMHGTNKGIELFNSFKTDISSGYKEKFSPNTAVLDVLKCCQSIEDNQIKVRFYRFSEDKNSIRVKVCNNKEPLPLAKQIPVFTNMGLNVISEHPYIFQDKNGNKFWIHDFYLTYDMENDIQLDRITANLELTFIRVWYGYIENDSFNSLALIGAMEHNQVAVFRAYAHYMKQTSISISENFIATTLYSNIDISILIWELFQTRFDIHDKLTDIQRLARQKQIQQEVSERLEQVDSLSKDHILRRYIELIMSTLRTNFYQQKNNNEMVSIIAFKIAADNLSEMPKPIPKYEIFVYSSRFEGVHLRGGKVARGGLRWSDRHEDFRTEILGLVKAQQVKNSVIVPVGAKGGFVCKNLPTNNREAYMQEGISCYKKFIRSLISITDNFVDDVAIKPPNTLCYDDDDYYFVVAADKGTATFSDIANEISKEYDFWLGDAFASGGSIGYDHKKMGITAKGAWVSVQRHFIQLGIDIQNQSITVVGIGDMSGDVFGNGMLLSNKIELLAAFNHLHIFIDPYPNIAKSYKERKRLFNLPRSGWNDYNTNLISSGGGVFLRSAKFIKISNEMKKRFDINDAMLTPSALISKLLKAPVDLIWNGGIGTYVKASFETHENVGDHTNDNVRVNGNELRCKVIGEGGNLGFTQLARVEFSLLGGIMNTDFIDNVGGVDCSDHEVNIKIFLNYLVKQKIISFKERNKMLEELTNEVSSLVLKNNYRQSLSISLAQENIEENQGQLRKLIHELEQKGKLDRSVEFLPDDDSLNDRLSKGKTLTRPEISLLMSYSKHYLKEQLMDSDIFDDEYINREMLTAFPFQLKKKYQNYLLDHQLKKEIAATQLANYVCNIMGITFNYKLQNFTGSSAHQVLRAFIIIRDIYNLDEWFQEIEQLDLKIKSSLQLKMMSKLRIFFLQLTRWMLQMNLMKDTTQNTVEYYREGIQYIMDNIPCILSQSTLTHYELSRKKMLEQSVPDLLAKKMSALENLASGLFIVQLFHENQQTLKQVAKCFAEISDFLSLDWIFSQLNNMNVKGSWQIRAKETCRDQFFVCLKLFLTSLFKYNTKNIPMEQCMKEWQDKNMNIFRRWKNIINEIKLENNIDLSMIMVAGHDLYEICNQVA